MIIQKEDLQIPKIVQELLGIEIYLVGGAVRDILLGKKPKDWDFTTPLNPEEIQEAIQKAGRKPYLLGKKFGTIGCKIETSPKHFEYIEITTFRKEIYSKNSRKPKVEFITSIEDDLSRRDFTINAMAISSSGELLDFRGGLKDLENKIIKSVGNAKTRFREDPLRILRAVRFAGTLNFKIEKLTWEKMLESSISLLKVSKERWVVELDKILKIDSVQPVLDLLMDSGVLRVVIPELSLQKDYDQNSSWHDFDLWTHTKKVIDNCPCDNLDLRWSALLHDIAKPFTRIPNKHGLSSYYGHEVLGCDIAEKTCKYLKFSNNRTSYILETISNHMKKDCILKPYDDMSKKKL